jgi:uncharacterized protein (DUF4415 family)
LKTATVISRRKRGRPKLDVHKAQLTIRLDRHVLERFRTADPKWQSRINLNALGALGHESVERGLVERIVS